jgi:alpha-tubulin suppressor-like RCC1 family protein
MGSSRGRCSPQEGCEDGCGQEFDLETHEAPGTGQRSNQSLPILISMRMRPFVERTPRRFAARGRVRALLLIVMSATVASCGDQTQPTGNLWTWGSNEAGQLGDGASGHSDDHVDPIRLALSDVSRIVAGNRYSLALKRDGTLWEWGSLEIQGPSQCLDETGPLGRIECIVRPTPVALPGGAKAKSIGAGRDFALAVLDNPMDSTVCRWGQNQFAQLGNNTLSPTVTPVCTAFPAGVLYVDGGGGGRVSGGHALAITTGPPELKVWSWGRNDHSQAGNICTATLCPSLPCGTGPLGPFFCVTDTLQVPVGPGTYLVNVIGVSAGNAHSLALKADGSVWAWGSQDEGQLGVPGASEDAKKPVRVSAANNNTTFLAGVSDIAAGGSHNLALKSDGHVWAWGFNNFGQIGAPTNLLTIQSFARDVPGLDHVTRIAAGEDFSLALKSDGTLWAWGRNDHGQLGAPSNDKCGPQQVSCSLSPIQVRNLTGVTAISAGGAHSLALTAP